jgi:prepilin-type N-terminal cleavage/methylation domain-containing protein
MQRIKTGFTIVELIVVVAVIGVLASIVMVNYSGAQAKARDTKRISQLTSIAEAITSYRLKYNDQLTSATCAGGYNAGGSGWFNYIGTNYTKDILSCLTDVGYLDKSYVDPFGCGSTGGANAPGYTCKRTGYSYMKSTCTISGQTVTVMMARLETQGDVADLQGANALCSSSSYATSYGMNYMVRVD